MNSNLPRSNSEPISTTTGEYIENYVTKLNKTNWKVPLYYQQLTSFGFGTYGQVCKAMDTKRNRWVAIKKLARPFSSSAHAKRTFREIFLLKRLKHDNIIKLFELYSSDNDYASLHDIYIITELMGGDLSNVIKSQQLSPDHIVFISYQILRGLKFIHSAGVIHRDLKPANIGISENCDVKILDFGLARQSEDVMTGYISTRWYRAPEVMLNWMCYTEKVDIWSVGCIMIEMLTQKVLFPGNEHVDQLNKILALLGKPSNELIESINSIEARTYVKNLPPWRRQNFCEIFPMMSITELDLYGNIFILNPTNRYSSIDCLAHPYFEKFANPEDEPTCTPVDTSLEKKDLLLIEWKSNFINFKRIN
ncbi:hypothetical protein A3Q56_04147 [Intoshia linei]|uniref:mitogen-activated protein kinase n=1 Tax=Intoshia linei TaxID=1819745 RepID=A0A177B1G3_9BILA|nr:hypothetical protein A3Q56_04147 [Intoshia linei]